MKLLALLGLVALAAALPTHLPTLQYRFSAQTVSYLPAQPGSATTIRALVSAKIDKEHVLLQLSEVQFAQSLSLPAGQVVPFERLDELELPENTRQALLLPIRFHYKHGVVSSIEFAHDEPVWTENIKKAIVNMFHMNMHKIDKQLDQAFDYYLTEKNVEGVCKTTYTVLPTEEQFEMVKAIDYTQCETKPTLRGLRFSTPLIRDQQRLPLIARLSEQKMLIEKDARLPYLVESKAVYSTEEMRTEILMTLEKKTTLNTHITLPREMRKTDLVYSDKLEMLEEKLYKKGDMTFLQESPVQYEDIVRVALSLLDETEESLVRVIPVLRLCTIEQLQSIHEQIEEKTIRHSLFHRALVLAGTRYTVEHMLEEMMADRVDKWEMYSLIQHIAETRYPSELIVQKMWELIESVSEHKALRQAALLSTGSLMRAVCFEEHCEREIKMKWVKMMEKELISCDTDAEKVVIVKMLANAGFDMVVFPLEKLIHSEESVLVRSEAVEALLSLRYTVPRKLVSLLMPLIKDRRQLPEIRSIAVRVLLSVETLDNTHLIQIVNLLNAEKDMHFYTYTLSLLKNEERFEFVRGFLRPRKTFTIRYARVFNKEISLGAIFQHLTTKTGLLPKEMTLTLENVFGTRMHEKLFEVRMRQENLEQLVYTLIKTLPVQTAEKLRSLASEMGVVPRRASTLQPSVYLFLTYKGMNYAVLPLEEITSFFRTLPRVSELKKTLSFFWATFVHDHMYRVPTILGLPLVYTEKTPLVAGLKGSFLYKNNKLAVEFDGAKMFSAMLIRSLRVEFPFAISGHKMIKTIRIRLPIRYTVVVDGHNKIHFKLFTEKFDKKPVFLVEIRPLNYITRLPEIVSEKIEEEQKTVLLNIFNFNHIYGNELKMKVRGHDNVMEILFHKTAEVPEFYHIYMVRELKEEKMLSIKMDKKLAQIGEWNKTPLVSRIFVTLKAEEKKIAEITFDYLFNSLVQHFEMLVRHEDRQIIKAHLTQTLRNNLLFNKGKVELMRSLIKIESVLGRQEIKSLVNYDIESKYELLFARLINYINTYPMIEMLPIKNADNKVLFHIKYSNERVAAKLETPERKMILLEQAALPEMDSCLLKDSRVSTFDDVIFRTPLSKCYQVLAKDCSDKPRFAVLVKKTLGDYKMVKIIDTEKEIEVEKKNGEFVVYVDGEMINMRSYENYGIFEEENKIVISSALLTVEFSGKTVKTLLGWEMQGQLCGLCGHYDGDMTNEFIRADNTETDDLEEFHRSFMVEKKECRDEKMEKIYQLEKEEYELEEDEEEMIREEETLWEEDTEEEYEIVKKEKKIIRDPEENDYDETTPMEKTLVREMKDEICFSLQPVPVCEKNTVIDEEKTIKVRFFCMERFSVEAHRLIREARREVLDLSDRTESLIKTIRVPKTCIAF